MLYTWLLETSSKKLEHIPERAATQPSLAKAAGIAKLPTPAFDQPKGSSEEQKAAPTAV